MADVTGGKTITLGSGTLGVVLTTPIIIDKIRITWSGASVGNVNLETVLPDDHPIDGEIIMPFRISDDPNIDYKGLVEEGYDRCAYSYSNDRSDLPERELNLVTDRLPHTSSVLDVGCGSGVPLTSLTSELDSIKFTIYFAFFKFVNGRL